MFDYQLEICVAATILIVGTWLLKSIAIIETRHFSIIERLGKYNRVAMPGIHLICWPFEVQKQITRSEPHTDGEIHPYTRTVQSYENKQLDIPAVDALTNDGVKVDFDTTLMYNVIEMHTAVYATEDIMNFFYQCARQAIVNTIADHSMADIRSKSQNIAGDIVSAINDKIVLRGLKCSECIVQRWSIDDVMQRKQQDIVNRQREQELLLASNKAESALSQMRAKHAADLALANEKAESELVAIKDKAASERAMIAMQRQLKEQETKQTLESKAAEHKYKLEYEQAKQLAQVKEINAKADLLVAQSANQKEVHLYGEMIRIGFSPQQLVHLEESRLKATMFNGAGKVVYAPLEYWSASRKEMVVVPKE